MAGADPWEVEVATPPTKVVARDPWETDDIHAAALEVPGTTLASKLESASQGAGQGLTLGYLPQLQAMAEPAITKIGDLAMGTNVYDELPGYAQRRDQWLSKQLELQKANPKSYMGGQLAGGVTGGLAIPGGVLAKGAGLIPKIQASVASGLAMRALQNPGDTKGEVSPLQLGERGTAMLDPTSVAMDTALPGIGPALRGAGKGMGSMAERAAFKAVGPYQREARQAFDKNKINDIGRTVLDSGALGSGLPKSYEMLANRLSALKDRAGSRLTDTVESMAQKETGTPIGLSREQIASNLENQMLTEGANDAAGIAGKNEQMANWIDNFRRGGLPPDATGPIQSSIPLLEAEMKKRALNKTIKWDRLPGADIPPAEEFNRALSGQLRQGVETGSEQLAAKTGFDTSEFRKIKSEYGNLAAAESIAEKRGAKEFANRLISPSDYGVGTAGAAIGTLTAHDPASMLKHGVMGAGLGLANKAARLYGNQVAARALNSGGKMAVGTGNVLSNMSRAPIANTSTWNTLYNNEQKNKGY